MLRTRHLLASALAGAAERRALPALATTACGADAGVRCSSVNGASVSASGSDAGPSRPGRQRAAGAPATAAAAPSAAPAGPALDTDVVSVVMRAVENCRPLMQVRQSKVGNRMSYVPIPLGHEASTKLAVKWILQAAAKRRDAARGSEASMAQSLATELLLAYQRKGGARTKRDELHKLALDNRANVRGGKF
ncbi:hypothetical protein GPECTOR_28g786 [Gonium pectorale]|uniref:Small ribosomal subunit protein uS7 domain-containing protein n=1 Tax=Gonium pectorale TaxID=33097 RepID=A0A150GEV4_GONPE|nr:hypothetical protein GPECTOR_28g786 [Gonium pectorale]|eukprot:KXZ48379.1 hypothetical protein GPECTOR_28g786 [Gonium pectorale]